MSTPAALSIVTPEGVPLDLTLASLADRIGAFVTDMLVLVLATLGLSVLFAEVDDTWLRSFLLLVAFALQNFYFIIAETRGGGTTIGKRRAGIRVVDARGGPLPFEAIVVRNVMRIVEVYLPFVAVLHPSAFVPNAPLWAQWAGIAWLLGLAAVPYFNVRRMRVGDLVAGTCVIRAPRAALLPDIASVRSGPVVESGYSFSVEQLSVYGVYELQVLEDVLRIDRPVPGRRDALRAVADRIRRKIEWPSRIRPGDVEMFLRAYYAALRSHLEGRMLLGRKKRDKHSDEEHT